MEIGDQQDLKRDDGPGFRDSDNSLDYVIIVQCSAPSESGLNTGLVMNERSLSRASGTCWSASPEKMVDT